MTIRIEAFFLLTSHKAMKRIAFATLVVLPLSAMPIISIAQSPDPYSVSFAIAGALANAVDSNSRKGWETSTDNKLDKILDGQASINADLKKLRVDMDNMLDSKFSDFVKNVLASEINQFYVNYDDIVLFEKITERKKQLIEIERANLEKDIVVLDAYGPASFDLSFAAMLPLKVIYNYTKTSSAHQRAFFSREALTYSHWMSSTPGYPAFVLAQDKIDVKGDVAGVDMLNLDKNLISGNITNGFRYTDEAKSKLNAMNVPEKVENRHFVLKMVNQRQSADVFSNDYNEKTLEIARLTKILGEIKFYHAELSKWQREKLFGEQAHT